MFECVVNVSEGRSPDKLRTLSLAAGDSLRDLHYDPWHHRSVFTLIHHRKPLEEDVRELARRSLIELDITHHEGVHPRRGVLDVVPFVAYNDDLALAREMRDSFGRWLAQEFSIPVFFYGVLDSGPSRTLPEIRRRAFRDLEPDLGPRRPHPRYGSTSVGVRGPLVAWNIWLRETPLVETRRVAQLIRGDEVRALGLAVDDATQVSCNLVSPLRVGPGDVFRRVTELVGETAIDHCELVGLIPDAVLQREPRADWARLGLDDSVTIEARVAPLS